MSAHYEKTESPLPITGEQPVSPVVQRVLLAIHNAKYRSELEKHGYFGGATLARKVSEGVITPDEMDEVSKARDLRKRQFTSSTDTIPDEVPESVSPTLPLQEEWSPTSPDKLQPVELSGRDRAANEHNQRREA